MLRPAALRLAVARPSQDGDDERGERESELNGLRIRIEPEPASKNGKVRNRDAAS